MHRRGEWTLFRNITDVRGVRVGHFTDLEASTGCTVVLFDEGAVGGVDVRGSAPGTRETEVLRPVRLVQHVHAFLLTGGSAFGLDAAGGVMQYLEEQGKGFNVGGMRVPIVPAAVIFDLQVGRACVRPGFESGYLAAQGAREGEIKEGSVGAGTGATVGKVMGPKLAMKGGVGSWSIEIGQRVLVGALAVVNAFGDVIDENGRVLAGTRDPETGRPAGSYGLLVNGTEIRRGVGRSTTLAVVATNARLSKEEVNKVAQMGQDGLARSISPAHTIYDGDTVFAAATGERPGDVNAIGAAAAEVVAQAIRRAVIKAEKVGGIIAHRDLREQARP